MQGGKMKRIQDLKKNKEFLEKLGKVTDKEIAAEYGIHYKTVAEIRRNKGIKAKRIHKYPIGIELYAGKVPDRVAAETLKCPIQKVFLYRVENRIEPCKNKKNSSKANDFILAYEELGTLQKVADRYGITRERVRQVLKKAGYKKRYYNFTAREKKTNED